MGKSGIPFVPLDCQLDDKFELIEAEFGLAGFAVVIKLFQRIYGMQGYYCSWTNEVALVFGKKIGLSANVVSEIVRASVKRGLFDKDIFDKFQILTSRGIQKRYFETVKRRKNVNIINEYLLINCALESESVDISSENVCRNSKNADISDISKVKVSKDKLSKEKYAAHVALTENEYSELVTTHGQQAADNMISMLNDYKEAKGADYKSDYAAIRKWVVDAYNERQAKNPKPKIDHSYDLDDFYQQALHHTPNFKDKP